MLKKFIKRLGNDVSAAESQQIFNPPDILSMLEDSISFIQKYPGLEKFVPNRCLDLGSGQGYVLLVMALFLHSVNDSLVVGIEFDLNLVMSSIRNIYRLKFSDLDLDQIRKKVIVLYGNIFHLPKIDFNVVYSYLITQDMSENLFYKILELCLSSKDVTLLFFSETTQVHLYSPLGLLCCLLANEDNEELEKCEVSDITKKYNDDLNDLSEVEATLYKRLKKAGGDLLIKRNTVRTLDLGNNMNSEYMYALNVHNLRFRIGPKGTNKDFKFILQQLRDDTSLVSRDAKKSQENNPTWETDGLTTSNLFDSANLRIDPTSGRSIMEIQEAVKAWSKDETHFIAPVLHNEVQERRSRSLRNNTTADNKSKTDASEAIASLVKRRKINL